MNYMLNIFKLIRQYEIVIASNLVIIVVLILANSFIAPNMKKAAQISRQENVLKKQLAFLKEKHAALSKLDKNSYQNNFSKMNVILPDTKDYVSLFNTFDKLETQNQVSITRTGFQLGIVSTSSAKLTKAVNSSAYVLPLNISVVGNLPSIQNFLISLKDLSGRLITLEKLDFVFNINGNLELNASGQAYFYPFAGTIGGIASPLPKISGRTAELLGKINSLPELSPDMDANINVNLGKKDLFQ